MNQNDMIQRLITAGQEHLAAHYDTLTAAEQETFLRQLASLDLTLPAYAVGENNNTRGTFSPLQAVTAEEAREDRAFHEALGLAAIRRGEVAAVLLAGGQGTRLGYDAPKGFFNVGITREMSLFSLHFANIARHAAAAGRSIPFLIMTSKFNHEQTADFLRQHDYFGYPAEDVILFPQEMAVCTDFEGKILLARRGVIAESPNGNGGWFGSIEKAGLLPELQRRGVRWLNVFSVDNALQQIADPGFIGAVLAKGCESGAKVVAKADPDERVGILCLEDGRPSIVEYYEATEEMRTLRDANGSLQYRYGVILNYLFSMERLPAVRDARLPVHRAAKKIPYMDANGEIVTPTEPNGYKYETLALDMVRLQSNCLPYEVLREKEFAPIKNKEGADSPVTARALLEGAGFVL